jgi:tetratricopeptide (TPR) repeat protein
MTMKSRMALLTIVASISTASIGFAADEPLSDAKALFAAASFDSALAALERLDAANAAQPEALEYKALCLLALGRPADAQKITETLVTTVPTFAPAEEDLSPRFFQLLTDTRRRIVPTVARRLFADAREQFRAKKTADAQRAFEEVMTLAGDRVWRETAEAEDLRTLASGFLDLLAGASAPAPAPASAPAPKAAAEPPPAAPAVVPPSSPAAKATALAQVEAPVPIRQTMPKWVAPDRVSAMRTFHGAIKLRIGADGHVVDASMGTPTHPDYDKLLLDVARTWLYKPAMRNGQPIEVEKVVEFYLQAK